MKRLVVAAVVAAALLAVAAPADATQPRRLCGPEVELTGIPGHLDVEINGVSYQRPGTGPWSVTFEDADGRFSARYFNEFGDWGTATFDIGPAENCDSTAPTTTAPQPPEATALPATTVASPPTQVGSNTTTPAAPATLPATGSSHQPAIAVGGLLVAGGLGAILLGRRRFAGRESAE
jgi:LPXTG-motif cell wall-anchored protein